MELNDYQKSALQTAKYPREYSIVYPALGLNGEAGEVADKVKKVIRDNAGDFSDEKKHEIALELGDVLWYVATMAHDMGYSLETIARLNVEKLASRLRRNCLSGSGDHR